MRCRRLCVLLGLTALSFALLDCSDDGQPPGDRGVGDRSVTDGKNAGDKPRPGDKGGSVSPEARTGDTGIWKCTPGQANMCDDYKTQYCLSGVCTACPASKTDCDRTGDCECAGICDGTKCKVP